MAKRQQRQKFTIAVADGVPSRVEAFVEANSPGAVEWWEERLRSVRRIQDPGKRREARAELVEERDRRRRAGEHPDNSSAVMLHQVLVELGARGWLDRTWGPVSPGYAKISGRPRGVATGSRGELPDRLEISLPDDVAELLRRAVWGSSRSTVRRLEALAKTAVERPLSRAEIAEKVRLEAGLVTLGDVVRAAAARVEPP